MKYWESLINIPKPGIYRGSTCNKITSGKVHSLNSFPLTTSVVSTYNYSTYSQGKECLRTWLVANITGITTRTEVRTPVTYNETHHKTKINVSLAIWTEKHIVHF
jgi:hypothetical protein